MLNKLFERQAAIQAHIDEYAPVRELFEEFLKTGQEVDGGVFWWITYGERESRYNWERQEVFKTAGKREIVVKASTNPVQWKFGRKAGDIPNALIDVRVSLPENSAVAVELELPPVWALLEQSPDFLPPDLDKLDKLGEELKEIVPLVRALLPQS